MLDLTEKPAVEMAGDLLKSKQFDSENEFDALIKAQQFHADAARIAEFQFAQKLIAGLHRAGEEHLHVSPEAIWAKLEPSSLVIQGQWEIPVAPRPEEVADFLAEVRLLAKAGTVGLSHRSLQLDRSMMSVRALERVGRVQDAVNLVHRAFDDALRDGAFADVNEWLELVKIETESVDVLLSLLTVTFPARTKLPVRSSFFNRIERSLGSRGLLEPGLLDGLK